MIRNLILIAGMTDTSYDFRGDRQSIQRRVSQWEHNKAGIQYGLLRHVVLHAVVCDLLIPLIVID